MDSTQKMLQTIINGQSAMKSELLTRINDLDRRLSERIDNLENKMVKGFKRVDEDLIRISKRIDKLGLQIANLEDDAPTVEEFSNLEKRVSRLEKKVLSN